MVVETPLALRYILSDDLFLLKAEQSAFADHVSLATSSEVVIDAAPVPEIKQEAVPIPTPEPVVHTPPQPVAAASPAVSIPSLTMPPPVINTNKTISAIPML